MEKLKQITKEIEQHGGKAFIVGGFVRDRLMALISKDVDVEVYNIQPNVLESILMKYGNPKLCGQSFGVYKLDNYDFSFPRKETKNGTGHKGFDVEIDPYMLPADACRRRDLTINAIMLDPITYEIIDHVGGVDDLKERVLRHVSEAFGEDPLRVMRVAQFAARFDFRVHWTTKIMCQNLVDEMVTLPKERLYTELEKILLKAPRPSIAFNFLNEIGALEKLFPELHALVGVEQGMKWHPEGDAFKHTMLALDSVPYWSRNMVRMLGVLCHDFGKAVVEPIVETEPISHVRFHGHPEEGVAAAETFLRRLTDEVVIIESVKPLVEFHMFPNENKFTLTKKQLRRLALKVNIPDLMVVHEADLMGRGGNWRDSDHIEGHWLKLWEEVEHEIKPLIKGQHLIDVMKMTPGKHFGPILKTIFEAQLDGAFNTVEGGIEWLQENWFVCLQGMKLHVFDEEV